MFDELDVLVVAYRDLAEVVSGLDEESSWAPSGCVGWAARDLVLHLLGDAQRALVALGTPAAEAADRTAVTYWTDAPSGHDDPQSRQIRALRTMASAWELDFLTATYAETTAAVLVYAARAHPEECVSTQGHTLSVRDLVTTLAVEGAMHHLDLVANLPDQTGPGPQPLALVRRTLEGLLGGPAPAVWDDRTWALIGTGRQPLTPSERAAFGTAADRLPLLS